MIVLDLILLFILFFALLGLMVKGTKLLEQRMFAASAFYWLVSILCMICIARQWGRVF